MKNVKMGVEEYKISDEGLKIRMEYIERIGDILEEFMEECKFFFKNEMEEVKAKVKSERPIFYDRERRWELAKI